MSRGSGLHGLQSWMQGSKVPHTSSAITSHADAVRIRETPGDVLQGAVSDHPPMPEPSEVYRRAHARRGNDLLRERVIGTEVLGRNSAYEPGEDPVVRGRLSCGNGWRNPPGPGRKLRSDRHPIGFQPRGFPVEGGPARCRRRTDSADSKRSSQACG